jgi:hypothetical protein
LDNINAFSGKGLLLPLLGNRIVKNLNTPSVGGSLFVQSIIYLDFPTGLIGNPVHETEHGELPKGEQWLANLE